MIQAGDIYLIIFIGFAAIATAVVVAILFMTDRSRRQFRRRHRDRSGIRQAVHRRRVSRRKEADSDDNLDGTLDDGVEAA